MKNCRNLMLFVGLMSFVTLAHAQLYTWRDASGVVHYSDKLPEDQQSSVKPLKESSPDPDGTAQSLDLQRRAQEVNKQFEEKQTVKKEETAQKGLDLQQKRANCETARNYLRTLQSGIRLVTVGNDGQRDFMTPEQIQAETDKTNKTIAESCS